jgi:hypothetical protein
MGIVSSALLLATSVLAAQPASYSFDRVKQLYESAAYDEALAALDRLAPSDGSDGDVILQATLEYRALCLLALDRMPDAEQVIEHLMARHPSYRPDPNATSPRFVSLVDSARSRVVPLLARRQYDSARRDFDGKRYVEAAEGFAQVVALLDTPALIRSVPGSSDDFRTVAAGFLELSRAAAAQALPPDAAPPRGVPAVYAAGDPDVVAPVPVKQDLPAWKHPPLGFLKRFEGQLDVVIDEKGNVESAEMAKPIFAGYDELAIAGAMGWKYLPATRYGVPVKFRKSVLVGLTVK